MNREVKKVFVLTTAMLSFISFWKAGSVVLCDFASSAYYAGGIAAKAYGSAFPYFILGVMLLSGFLLMAYIESSSLFVRGGVYVMVKNAMGKTMAKISVAMLLFDYLLTAPISAISAGLYLGYLLEVVLPHFNIHIHFPPQTIAVIFSILVILYFLRKNIKGVKESSEDNVKIIVFVGFVAVLLISFSLYTIYKNGFKLPEFRFSFTDESLGVLKYFDFIKPVGLIAILIAFGHSILALSGLETLAQVYREIEDPKIINLKKTVIFIFVFAFIFTGLLTFFSSVIIPYDKIINEYSENLLSGLAMSFAIDYKLRIILKTLVVVSAVLILVGAVNTAIVGANGILNRICEDKVLPDSLRKLHPLYGTTYRIIYVVAILQIIIVILSGGNIFLLGEAYAFGVLWSLTFNLLSLIVLRFKKNEEREWKFPFNIKVYDYEIPLGLIILFLFVFTLSFINLFTKMIATVSGIGFTIVLYFAFSYFEKKQNTIEDIHKIDENIDEEKINISTENEVLSVVKNFTKPQKILVAVKNPNNLIHLDAVLKEVDDNLVDVVVLYIKVEKGYEYAVNFERLLPEEKELFKNVISISEKYGKTVHPIMIFSNDPVYSILSLAVSGSFNRIVMGVSANIGSEVQLENIAIKWGLVRPKDFNSTIEVNIIWERRKLIYQLV